MINPFSAETDRHPVALLVAFSPSAEMEMLLYLVFAESQQSPFALAIGLMARYLPFKNFHQDKLPIFI
jgi:hypothetical protein